MFFEITENKILNIDSELTDKQIKAVLTQVECDEFIALYDVENQYAKLDGVDDDLEVIDYERTDAVSI